MSQYCNVSLLNKMIISLRRKNCPTAPIILVGTQTDRRGLLVVGSYKRSDDSPRCSSWVSACITRQQGEHFDQSDGQEAGQGDQSCQLSGVLSPDRARSTNFILSSGPGCSPASTGEKMEENQGMFDTLKLQKTAVLPHFCYSDWLLYWSLDL